MRRNIALGIGAVCLLIAVLVAKSCRDSTSSSTGPTSHTKLGSGAAGAKRTRGGAVAKATVAGRVTRASDGAGIAGAVVSLAPAELMAMLMPTDSPTLLAVTDANGVWKAPAVRPGAYVVAATARGFLPRSRAKFTVGPGEDKTGVDLVLTAGGTIVSGTVTDVGGGPIPEARVTATHSRDFDLSGKSDFVTTTNPDGKYELTLADGEYSLDAAHDDYTNDGEHVDVAGAPLTVDFQLVPGAVIRGQVVARDSGEPVPGALVRAESSGGRGGDGGVAFADDKGNFTLRSLDSGTIELYALGRGYATTTPATVALGVGEQRDGVKVLVDRAYSISGRVVRKGKPDQGLPGITIGAFSIAAKAFGVALEPTAADGAFEIVGLKPASYIIGAVGEGSVPEVGKNVEVIDKDVDGVVVEIAAGVTISGRVEPPIASVSISIEPQGQIGLANMFEAVKSALVHGETDEAGAFTLRSVPAGAFTLHAMARTGSAGQRPLIVGEVDQSGIVVKLEARASVSGRVIDTSGKPVAGIDVDARRTDDDSRQQISFSNRGRNNTTTRTDGSFTIVGLEAGKYRVSARSDDDDFEDPTRNGAAKPAEKQKNAANIELASGVAKTGVTLTVESRDGMIRGIVLAPDKKPAADAWVSARRVLGSVDLPEGGKDIVTPVSGSVGRPVLTNADGQFTIKNLRKGTYNLTVEGPKGATRGEKVGVKTGDRVTIQLASLGRITGKVTLAGSPVAKFDIHCDGKDDDKETQVNDKAGAYTLERVPPGKYECNVSGDAGTATGSVEVPAGDAKLDFALTRWATVTGVVVGVLDKKPIPGINVFAGNETFSAQNIDTIFTNRAPVTDANGRFVIKRVPVGKGKVAAMPKDGFEPLGTKDYTAAEGQYLDVGTIEIVPPRQGDAGTFGMSTNVEDKKLVVASVKEGGPAQIAGVLVGDRIVSINGRDVEVLTPMVASTLLQSGTVGVGQTAQLSIDRGGTTVNATLTSVKW